MARNQRNDPESLRMMIDGSSLLQRVLTLTGYIERGWMPEYTFPVNRPIASLSSDDFTIKDWVLLRPQDVTRLRVALDSYMKILNKVLPDLKSIDVTDNANLRQAVSQTELANRLYAALRKTPTGAQLLDQLQMAPSIDNARPDTLQPHLAPDTVN